MKRLNKKEVEDIIEQSPPGRNTSFLLNAHNSWVRFKAYETQPPFCYIEDGKVVTIIIAYFKQNKYANLYDICTIQGEEGKGYATKCWDQFVYHAKSEGIERLKISCTPESITWHIRNGLIFWGVDPSGSLMSDQILFSARQEQLDYRDYAVSNPFDCLPPKPAQLKLLKRGIDSHNFGEKKKQKINEAIAKTGKFWLRDYLLEANKISTVDSFYE